MENVRHPSTPTSNVAKFGDYDPSKYAIINVSRTFSTNEALQPGCPPHLTQQSIAKYLTPLTRELNEVPARPTINELPDAVIDQMVKRDKAFWVDKPGVNDYVIHDSYHHYGLSTEVVKPVMGRQHELFCNSVQKPVSIHCRDCTDLSKPGLTPFQLTLVKDPGLKRWRYYPDLNATLTREQIKASMDSVGRPFYNEACNWYYENYPPVKYNCIVRKFSK